MSSSSPKPDISASPSPSLSVPLSPSKPNTTSPQPQPQSQLQPMSTWSYILAAMMLGSSAGMTLYMRKSQTSAMLSRIKQMEYAHKMANPPKYGPPTKNEWERMRNRWGNDDE